MIVHRRSPVASALLVLALSACGSTVANQVRAPSESATGAPISNGSLSIGGNSSAAVSNGSGLGQPGQTSSSTASGGSSGAASVPTVGGGGPSGSALRVGQSSPLFIGVVGYNNTSTELGALGVKSLDTGDERTEARAIIDYLNAHGGIAGHPIAAIYHMIDLAKAAANEQSEMQAMCADFTQDHHVFAVISTVVVDSCLNDAHVPVINDIQRPTMAYMKKYAGLYYGPSDINMDREWRVTPQALYQAGFFSPHAKIGVIMWGPEDQPILDNDVKPVLARYGLTVADTVQFGGTAGEGGDAQSAVLKFQSEGIDHVLSIFTSPLFFMEAAESQRYFPSYGLNSEVGPALALQGNAPTDQLAKTTGVGWVPAADVDQTHQPGLLSNAQLLCHKIQRQAGNNLSYSASYWADLYCDELLALRDALSGASSVNVTTLLNGYNGLGNSYVSAVTFRSRISPGRPDGVAAYRIVRFDVSCSCFVYRTGDQSTQ